MDGMPDPDADTVPIALLGLTQRLAYMNRLAAALQAAAETGDPGDIESRADEITRTAEGLKADTQIVLQELEQSGLLPAGKVA